MSEDPPAGVSPTAQGFASMLVYTAAWAIVVSPLVVHLSRPQLYPLSPDPNFYVWSLKWWPYAVGHGLDPLHTNLIGAPGGYDLAWTNSIPALSLLLAPLTLAVGPVATFNVLVVLSLPLSAWAAFVLCRRLTGRFWPAFAGGALYGFSAFEMNHIIAGQVNLAFSALLPLLAYLAIRWHQGDLGSGGLVGLLALVLLAEFLISIELFADTTAVAALAFVTGVVVAGPGQRRHVLRLARLGAAAFGLALFAATPYLATALAKIPHGFAHSPQVASMDVLAFVTPRPGHTLGPGWLADAAARFPSASRDGYLGIPLVGIAIAFAVTNWSRRIARFLIVLLTIVVVISLGPQLHVDGRSVGGLPWGRLWHLPVVRSAFPARFMAFAFLIASVVVALWLARPRSRPWIPWTAAAVAVAAMAANTPALDIAPTRTPAFFSSGSYQRVLERSATVLVLPDRGNVGMLWQAQADMGVRLAGGFVGATLTPHFGQPAPISDVAGGVITPDRARRFRTFLHRARVDAILVDLGLPGRWPAILAKLGYSGRVMGGVLVYRT
jgi:hypothetical protein